MHITEPKRPPWVRAIVQQGMEVVASKTSVARDAKKAAEAAPAEGRRPLRHRSPTSLSTPQHTVVLENSIVEWSAVGLTG